MPDPDQTAPEVPSDVIRILFLGDIVGEPGRRAVINSLKKIKNKAQIDFVIANGENSAGGRGITPKIAISLMRAGVAVITTGDHCWDQREIYQHFEVEPRLLRPLNYPSDVPGGGSIVLETAKGNVAVMNVQGRTFMQPPLDNPFTAAEAEAERLREEANVIFVDFHAEASSEKIAMGRYLDGKVSAVVGTHTHVQTADEEVFPGGTAFLSDAGMCGPAASVLGRKIEPVLEKFRTGMPARFPVANGIVRLCGCIVDVEVATGKANSITRFKEFVENP